MKKLSLAGLLLWSVSAACAADTGMAFYGDPPDAHHPWCVHDRNREQPKVITPGSFSSQDQPGKPPSDAVVLFDGKDLSKWQTDKKVTPATTWDLLDGGILQERPGAGNLVTKESLGDCQLHIEWAAPTEIKGTGQQRGNSGIFLMGILECQVLDNYENPTYADGQAGAIYGVNPPMVNPLRPPGQFQAVDIVFRRPITRDNVVVDPGYMTVLINGVLVQDHTALEGPTGHRARYASTPGKFPDAGPLKLQDHGTKTQFRNIWYRPLPPRATEGGPIGLQSEQATLAQRQKTAGMLREKAAGVDAANALEKNLLLMESLVYAPDESADRDAKAFMGEFAAGVKALSGEQLNGRKDEIIRVRMALRYMSKNAFFPADFAPLADLEALCKAQGWDKK